MKLSYTKLCSATLGLMFINSTIHAMNITDCSNKLPIASELNLLSTNNTAEWLYSPGITPLPTLPKPAPIPAYRAANGTLSPIGGVVGNMFAPDDSDFHFSAQLVLASSIDPATFAFTTNLFADDLLIGTGLNGGPSIGNSASIMYKGFVTGNNTLQVHILNTNGSYGTPIGPSQPAFLKLFISTIAPTTAQCNKLTVINASSIAVSTTNKITGTGDPGASINVSACPSPVTADASGNWECTPATPIAPAATITATPTYAGTPIIPVGTPATLLTPNLPSCIANPTEAITGEAVTFTCSNIAAGNTISIPGTSCAPTPSTGGAVTCTGIAGTGNVSSNPVALVTNPSGITAQANTIFNILTPACISPASAVNGSTPISITCTGIPVGASTTIPGLTCTPSPVTTSATPVVCTGLASAAGNNPTAHISSGAATASIPMTLLVIIAKSIPISSPLALILLGLCILGIFSFRKFNFNKN